MRLENLKTQLDAQNADLSGSRFVDVALANAVFEDVNLTGARFADVNLTNLAIVNADLTGMTIDGVRVADLFAAYTKGTA